MKQQTRFYVSRKNPLTWIAAALSLASIVLQILALCLGEGAVISTVNIWFQKVLPMAVSLGFALQLVLEGETRFYRTSKPIFWACVYFGQAALDLHLHGGYALFGYMRYVVMCWILYLLLYLIYRLTITGKIPVSYPLLFTLLVPLAILIYDLAMAGMHHPAVVPPCQDLQHRHGWQRRRRRDSRCGRSRTGLTTRRGATARTAVSSARSAR